MNIFLAAASLLLIIMTLPGTVELLLVTIGAWLPLPLRPPHRLPQQRLAVLIPAHNEAAGITATLESLKACQGPADLIVIADNCTDRTAELAAAAGARLLVRNDPLQLGKPYALAFAFQQLSQENFDAYLIIDADSRVKSNLLQAVQNALSTGSDAAQVKYVLDGKEDSMRSRFQAIAFTAFNVLRPRGRSRLGLSAGIFGNGSVLTRRLLNAIPFAVTSLVEDVAYHLKIVEAGYRVDFIEESDVVSAQPIHWQGRLTQRKRWEGGRLRLLLDQALHLLAAILKGRWRLIEPLLDLLLLPLGYHCLLLFLLIPLCPWYALGCLGVVFLHICAAIHVAGGGWKNYLSILYAPAYLLWKVMHMGSIACGAQRDQPWERTQRKGD